MVISNLTTIVDRQLGADEANVVLVDGVDTPQPTVETLAVAPRLSGDGDALTRAAASDSRLRAFLQCDVALPTSLPGVPSIQLQAMRMAQSRPGAPQSVCAALQR